MNSRQLYFRILGEIKPYWHIVVFNMLCLGLAAAVDAGMSLLLKPLIDQNLKADSLAQTAAWVVPAQIFGLAVLRMLTNFGNEYTSNWLGTRVVADLRDKMFARMIAMPVRFFDQSSTGVLISRITNDVNQIMQAGIQVMTVFIRDTLSVFFFLGVMFYQSWQLSLLCIGLIPVVAISIRVIGRRQRRLARESQNQLGIITSTLDEAFSGQRVVKIFGGQDYEKQRFGGVNNRLRLVNVKQTATSSLNSSLMMLMIGITLAVVIYFATLQAQSGALSAGGFVSFISAMMLMQAPIKSITKMNEQLNKGLAAAESVYGVLDQFTETDTGKHSMARAQGNIRIEGLRFHYGDSNKWALDGIDLEVRAGESIALVGSSGSGKTTLANLMPRFYEPVEGRILLDGVALADYQLGNLRSQIALVSQDVVLFNDSVSANIAYGDARPDMERIRAAADAAFATEFIEQMAQGFDTELGENGVRLSGGQRQRLAIARAIYKNAPILILDEATSALDTESERKVQAALENLMKNRTTLVIAHRLSTIENADRIVVMRHGKIVETGRHAELLAQGGLYTQMHAVQFSDAA
ncbi:lipid A export permease/ATP-binding protein MsbA [Chitinilyticum piscinae]|uniref:Lipid A export permease/ATP-binding protein MsbA n=1 Tax=Chitinilyticum piscinae TaxID=2866724 RepID=A0A8J7K135_9NEIS|nr:lipid A export permease/ATP-binding protein MsbA [Chitinilyticum piscinae]MBE9608062.1 lipid A export permease/ATP-binding protein MsbA [Chitinilyticum piscinae]